ncbi:MAG TPA: C-GCAxxG-C-C family (seleno)protein [Candidatus Methylomirabilis sp.]|nr:C-GCAxxG-C-C family (seleno)protein [Candidatus Methylomirabilis sp.]HSB77421.1 C-GCAxxG-C-C family (seleno)protein [Candidatus Methylomirabilis sp.]
MKPNLDHLTKAQIRTVTQLARRASRLANTHRKAGYHCSESVFAAVVEVLGLKVYPPAPKLASGFHGGGGRIYVGGEPTPTGCMCGALAGGVLALSALYGRTSPKGTRYGCIPYAAGYLHQRFFAEVGGKCCSMLQIPEQERQHHHGELLGILVERAMSRHAHVDDAENLLLEDFPRRSELVVREDEDLDRAVCAPFEVFGKHLRRLVPRMVLGSDMAESHGNSLGPGSRVTRAQGQDQHCNAREKP